MATIEMCFSGGKTLTDVSLDKLPDLIDDDGAFVWLDVDSRQPDDLLALQQQFGLHRIAVETALTEGERPRITLYEDMIYLEFYGLRLIGDEIETDEIGIFVGEKFLITVRRGAYPPLDQIRNRWHDDQAFAVSIQEPGKIHFPWISHQAYRRPPSTAMLLYAILDDLVDGYFPVVDWVGDEIEALEALVMDEGTREPQVAIQHMRTRLLRLRRLLSPQQEVLNTLLRRDVPIIPESIIPYFADVHDHVLRIHDWMESYRDQLSTIVDLQLSMQSNRLNSTMRTLTAWSIILMSSSLVAGVYGMNFVHMPELQWQYGYGFAILLMLTIGTGLFTMFRKWGWWK
jgi:magnesium transporter